MCQALATSLVIKNALTCSYLGIQSLSPQVALFFSVGPICAYLGFLVCLGEHCVQAFVLLCILLLPNQ